jgi:hypothetical protein
MNTTAQLVIVYANVKKDMNWAISSQATQKWAEGSTTRLSNLTQIGMKKSPRVQETLFSAYINDDMDKIWTVYKTTNLINGCVYYGVHGTTNVNDRYLGSGKIIKLSIKKYGRKNFKKTVLVTFDNAKDAFDYEELLVNTVLIKNQDVYNITTGGIGRRELSEEGLRSISRSRKNTVVAFDTILNKKVSITKCDFDSYPERFVGHTKGNKVMKDADNNTVVVQSDDDIGTLVGITKGFRPVIDGDGKTHLVAVDDPRLSSGELWSPSKGKTTVKDIDGNIFVVDVNDPRLKSRELVGVASGNHFTQRKKRLIITCPYCSKQGDTSNMKRWHFDGAKQC